MILEQTYTYYAFVSYSHKDETWGRWIQRALESYRLPAAVRKEVGKPLPQRIHPVFRDDTDLGAGRLADNLRQELEQSRYLIVVCSPNSAKPNDEGKHWVNEEVTRFCEMGRADRVIPVIVEGTADTSFCPKIVEEGLLGLDATRHSRARILNDLVAKILGLRPDELWRREERRLRAKRCWRAFAASLAASLVAFGGYVWWDCTRTVTRAFADYVDSYGLPEGIFPLTPEQVSHRHVHYRFEFRGYRYGKSVHADSAAPSLLKELGFQRVLRRVVQANSFGIPREVKLERYEGKAVIFDCSGSTDYLTDGTLQSCLLPRFGETTEQHFHFATEKGQRNVIVTRLGSGGESSKFSYIRGAMTRDAEVFDPISGITALSMTRIAKFRVLRDLNGHEIGTRFLASDGSPASDIDGIFGWDKTLDEHGRIVEERYLSFNKEGSYVVRENRLGIARKKFEYRGSNLLSVETLDADGSLVPDETGVAISRFQADAYGNVLSISNFNEKAVLVRNKNGVATFRMAYDDFGNRISGASFDETGTPVRDVQGIAKVESSFDELGNETELRFFDENGESTMTTQGFAILRLTRDGAGRVTSMASFDTRDMPTPGPDGQFSRKDEYDEHGRVIRMTYKSGEGQEVRNADGVASVSFSYDDSGNLAEITIWGPNGEATTDGNGIHQTKIEWDEFGHGQKSLAFFGTNGLPTIAKSGWHRVSYETRRGQIASETYFSTNGIQTLCDKGYSRITHKFDRMGNVTNETYWAPDGTKTCRANGPASWMAEYDDRGNAILIQTFAPDGSPADNGEGAFAIRRKYDRRGRITDEIALDASGRRTMTVAGFSRKHIEYDAYGRDVEETLFDNDDNPAYAMGEACRVRQGYDELGRLIWKEWTTEDNKPANNQTGVAKSQFQINELGHLTHALFLDKNGKPVPGDQGVPEVSYSLDTLGRPMKIEFMNGYGARTANMAGVSLQEMEYDTKGNNVKTVFFGPHHGRTCCPEGFAEVQTEFDNHGNPIRKIFFASDMSRINGPGAVGEIRSGYDNRGNLVWQGFVDINGNPMDSAEGFSSVQNEFNDGNRLVRKVFHGATPLSDAILASKREHLYEYDLHGILVRERIFNDKGEVVCGEDGWAERRVENSPSGQTIRETFFDENGKQLCDLDGVWEIVSEYYGAIGASAKSIENRAMPQGNGLFGVKGMQAIRRRFSAAGVPIGEDMLAEDGRPFTDWPNTAALLVLAVNPYGQAFQGGVRHGDLFFAFGIPDSGISAPLLFMSDFPGTEESRERDDFLQTMSAGINAKGATIVFARLEGGFPRFFEVKFPDGGVLDANKEIVVSASILPPIFVNMIKGLYKKNVPYAMCCSEILPDSNAEKAGIHAGDFVLAYGNWMFSPGGNPSAFMHTIDEMAGKEKTIVLARKEKNVWRPLTFHLPQGSMGICMKEMLVLRSDLSSLYSLAEELKDVHSNVKNTNEHR